MTNAYKTTTRVWVVDATGDLNTGGVWVTRVSYNPSANSDDLILTDVDDNPALALKAGLLASGQVSQDFSSENGGLGRFFSSLKVGTIDGGTAYIYFRSASQ